MSDESVTIVNGLEGLEDVVDRLAPGLRAALEDEARTVVAGARQRWPVASGRSRDGLEAGTALESGGIRGFVRNTVEYAIYVKSAKNGLQGRSAMVELMRRPVEAAAQRLVVRLGALFQSEVHRGQ